MMFQYGENPGIPTASAHGRGNNTDIKTEARHKAGYPYNVWGGDNGNGHGCCAVSERTRRHNIRVLRPFLNPAAPQPRPCGILPFHISATMRITATYSATTKKASLRESTEGSPFNTRRAKARVALWPLPQSPTRQGRRREARSFG